MDACLKKFCDEKKASNPYSKPSAVESIIIQSPQARNCEDTAIKEILRKAEEMAKIPF